MCSQQHHVGFKLLWPCCLRHGARFLPCTSPFPGVVGCNSHLTAGTCRCVQGRCRKQRVPLHRHPTPSLQIPEQHHDACTATDCSSTMHISIVMLPERTFNCHSHVNISSPEYCVLCYSIPGMMSAQQRTSGSEHKGHTAKTLTTAAHLQRSLFPSSGCKDGMGSLAGPHLVTALYLIPEQLRLSQPCARAQHRFGTLHPAARFSQEPISQCAKDLRRAYFVA